MCELSGSIQIMFTKYQSFKQVLWARFSKNHINVGDEALRKTKQPVAHVTAGRTMCINSSRSWYSSSPPAHVTITTLFCLCNFFLKCTLVWFENHIQAWGTHNPNSLLEWYCLRTFSAFNLSSVEDLVASPTQQFNLSVTPFSHDWNWLMLALYCSCSLVIFSSSFTLLCNKRHQKVWGQSLFGSFFLYIVPQKLQTAPFPWAPTALDLHRNSPFTSSNRTQKYIKACPHLVCAAGSWWLVSREKNCKVISGELLSFPLQNFLFFHYRKRRDGSLFLVLTLVEQQLCSVCWLKTKMSTK